MSIRRAGKLSSFKKKRQSDDGFTYLEILVALSVLVLVVFVVIRGFSGASRLIEKIGSISVETAKVLQVNEAVCKYVEKVRIPFWESDPPLQHNGKGVLVLPFLNGDAADELVLFIENGAFLMESRKTGVIVSIHGFNHLEWETLTDEMNRAVGIVLIIGSSDRIDSFTISARFGAHPL